MHTMFNSSKSKMFLGNNQFFYEGLTRKLAYSPNSKWLLFAAWQKSYGYFD